MVTIIRECYSTLCIKLTAQSPIISITDETTDAPEKMIIASDAANRTEDEKTH